MAILNRSQTATNLKQAFARESQATRLLLYFAQKADKEGHNDMAALFRASAEDDVNHAEIHLKYLELIGSPLTDQPIGKTQDNLTASIVCDQHASQDVYPSMAQAARREGFEDIAQWFDTLADTKNEQVKRFQKACVDLKETG